MPFEVIRYQNSHVVVLFADGIGLLREPYGHLQEEKRSFPNLDLPANIARLTTTINNAGAVTVLPQQTVSTDLDRLKEAAFNMHGQLLGWTLQLEAARFGQPQEEVNKGHDFLTYAHRGAYIILHRTTISLANRIRFCQQMALGAADTTSPHEFYQKAHTLSAPTGPNVWVNPNNGARVNLATSAHLSGSGNLNLLASSIPTDVDFNSGAWILELTE